MRNLSSRPKKSAGAALIIALVLLAAITVIGLSNIQSSSMEMKMVTASALRNDSFAIAESRMSWAVDYVENTLNLDSDDLYTDACANCFTNTCANGLCFDGEYESTFISRQYCEMAPNGASTARVNFAQDADIWSDSSRHILTAPNAVDGFPQAKFIVEFLCFVGPNIYTTPSTADPLFRVTLVYPEDGSSPPIMLQSTYTLDL